MEYCDLCIQVTYIINLFVVFVPTYTCTGGVLDCSEDVWDKIFDINVKAAFLLAKQAAPLITERGGGSIVFISSLAGYSPFKVRFRNDV